MRRARPTASMSAARRPSRAARCRCWPQPGSYASSTTYTIVSATGGVSGTYAGVTSNFAFLTPSLSYDANNVFLTLALSPERLHAGFGGLTPNQRAVGIALNQSFANATRRLRRGAQRDRRPQHGAGPARRSNASAASPMPTSAP